MENDILAMRRALELARRGEGLVEPNPMVGCVLVRNGQVVGEGYHRRFGGPHAEVEALRKAGEAAIGATCYVTLEPCSHYGKTPPCVSALLEGGVRRIVVAMRDPFPEVDGRGLEFLRRAGLNVTEKVLEAESRALNAPYLTRIEKRRPWVIAKWAMTLDGKLASRTGDSRWISGDESRKIVHRLRARMDAILVGSGCALHDDPMLNVRLETVEHDRPSRTPLRIVLNSAATISMASRLVRTAREIPVLIAVGPEAPQDRLDRLEHAGCEIFRLPEDRDVAPLLEDLARRGTTNLLLEGGANVFGDWFDRKRIDEVHAFIAPKILGGSDAPSPIGGIGIAEMMNVAKLESPRIQTVENDLYLSGRLLYETSVSE